MEPVRRTRWKAAQRVLKPLAWVYGGYLLLTSLFINLPLLPWLIQQPNSVTINWSWGVTPFPGWAYARGFYLTVEDENIQLGLRIDEVAFWYDPLYFPKLLFRVIKVDASGCSFRLRLKRTPEEAAANPERLAALPSIDGFPGVVMPRPPPSPPSDGNPSGIWTVRIEDAHAGVREAWIEGLRYDGAAEAYGAFQIQPMIHVDVDAHLRVMSGDMTYGSQRVASELTGNALFRLDPFLIWKESGAAPLRHIHCQLGLDGNLQNAKFLNPVLKRTPAPTFASSPGRFELLGRFEEGRFANGSTFRLRASDWQLAKGVYRSSGNYAQLEASIDGEPSLLNAVVSLGTYEVDNPNIEKEIIEGSGLLVRLFSQRLDLLDKPLDDLGFEIDIDRARLPDLRIVNDFLPASAEWEVLAGAGDVSGSFISPATGAGHGNVRLIARDASARLDRVRLEGGLTLDAQLTGVASNTKEVGILGRDELEGTGRIDGHFALVPLNAAPFSAPLATLETSAELVLHPLRASQMSGADVLHHLSGELQVAGKIPTLAFLDGTLEPHGVKVTGGAGTLSLDARLTHGILGRASELKFQSHDISIASEKYRAKTDLRVDAHVGQLSGTPKVELDARVTSFEVGSEEWPSVLVLDTLRLHADSPEVDVATLNAETPAAQLSIAQVRIRNLSVLNEWLPKPFSLSRGRASGTLNAALPPEGHGGGDLALQIDDLLGSAGEIDVRGQLTVAAKLSGIAERPWREEAFERSQLHTDVAIDGTAHLNSRTDSGGRARLAFRGNARFAQRTGDTGLADLLRGADGTAKIEGDLGGLAELNRYLDKTPLRLRGGTANVRADVVAANGKLAEGTTAVAETQGLELLAGPLSFGGPLELRASLGGSRELSVVASLPTFDLRSRFREQDYGSGHGLTVRMKGALGPVAELAKRSTLEAELDAFDVPHLDELFGLVPPLKGIVVGAGSAEVSAALRRDPSSSDTRGTFALRAKNVEAKVAKQTVHGDLAVDGKLVSTRTEAGVPKAFDLAGSTFELQHADFPLDKDYWAKVQLTEGALGIEDDGKLSVSGQATVAARDAGPFLHLYGSSLGIPRLLDGMLAFEDLRGTCTFSLDHAAAAVQSLQLEGDGIALHGRARRTADHTSGDFLLKLGPLAFGVDVRDSHTGFQLIGADGWYKKKLESSLP